uniref:Uncharacterized protein n=1 Tax=Meloidogyne enterolobii TaxID=390850 RepID=A0A6V7VVS1_MELEN|nr:unnamed protein product [Meloidogyne enterolobii]
MFCEPKIVLNMIQMKRFRNSKIKMLFMFGDCLRDHSDQFNKFKFQKQTNFRLTFNTYFYFIK